jgi:hypothetical protein
MYRATTTLMIVAALGLGACSVEQTEEGEMPQVNVEGGQLPNYDVDAPDVDVNSEQRTVTVPDVDVDVNREQRTVTVPDVDVKSADASGE